ncbi:MAG: FAD-dependent monooxygenase [Rhodobacteraceae bacterium]|nr:FAD-dependent monooxygenase [Paracoccaceae bacterium]
MALKGKNVTVLGAGIGGLTAAIALARRGAKVTVLEAAPELAEVGAGLQITPNGSAVLQALDLGPRLKRIGVELKAVELKDHHGGPALMRLDMARATHGNSHPYLLVHRADLIEMLASSARRHGVSLLFGKNVTGVAIGFDQVTLPLDDGPQRTTKLLVGADGVRSLTRQALDVRKKPVFTGQIAWRALIEARFVPVRDLPPVATIWMGPKRHLVTYPLRGGRLINVVAVEERADWVAESWNLKDDPDNLRRAFSGFAPELKRLLTLVDDVWLWGLFTHPVAETWSQSGAVILGDAAHPTLPFLAQGANMALEDAWVLAEEMDRHDDVQDAYAAYRRRRYARVKRIVAGARANTGIYHLGAQPLRFIAHRGMQAVNRFTPDLMQRRYNWLYGHDVTKGG